MTSRDLLTVTADGSVQDTATGLTYGRVTRSGSAWAGRTAPKVGAERVHVFRPTHWEAAVAVASAYVLGYEG